MFSAKSDYLNLIPRTHRVDEEAQPIQVVS